MESPFPSTFETYFGFIEWSLVALLAGLVGLAVTTWAWLAPITIEWANREPSSDGRFVVFLLVLIIVPAAAVICAVTLWGYLAGTKWEEAQLKRHCARAGKTAYTLEYEGIRGLLKGWAGEVDIKLKKGDKFTWVRFTEPKYWFVPEGSHILSEGGSVVITVPSAAAHGEILDIIYGSAATPPVRRRRRWLNGSLKSHTA